MLCCRVFLVCRREIRAALVTEESYIPRVESSPNIGGEVGLKIAPFCVHLVLYYEYVVARDLISIIAYPQAFTFANMTCAVEEASVNNPGLAHDTLP